MDSNCTDTSNDNYELFWFNYFFSIGYIDNSDIVNLYAPYGKCTRSSLWITYLINLIHFFLLSSGILYFLNSQREHSGFWWPLINWIVSLVFLIASIVFFILRNLNIRVFTILTIALQLSMLIVLWISIFIVMTCTFELQHRYHRCLFLFIIILLLFQICCFVGQAVITLHCLFNLKLISTSLDYAYWSAIIAASGTIISTLLLDCIFIWCGKRKISTRVSPAPPSQQNENRTTRPADSVILEDLDEPSRQPIKNTNDQRRRFHIQPNNQQSGEPSSNTLQNQYVGGQRNEHSLSSTSDA